MKKRKLENNGRVLKKREHCALKLTRLQCGGVSYKRTQSVPPL
jgi:hypothetical protein